MKAFKKQIGHEWYEECGTIINQNKKFIIQQNKEKTTENLLRFFCNYVCQGDHSSSSFLGNYIWKFMQGEKYFIFFYKKFCLNKNCHKAKFWIFALLSLKTSSISRNRETMDFGMKSENNWSCEIKNRWPHPYSLNHLKHCCIEWKRKILIMRKERLD